MCTAHMVVKGTLFHLSMLLQLQPGTIPVAVNSESTLDCKSMQSGYMYLAISQLNTCMS